MVDFDFDERTSSMLKMAVVLIPGLFVLNFMLFRRMIDPVLIFVGVSTGVLIGIGILDTLDRFEVVDVWEKVW